MSPRWRHIRLLAEMLSFLLAAACEGCLYRTTAHDTAHWDYSTGFRCCAD